MKHLKSNEKPAPADVHYGFRSNRSCEAQLFLTIDNLTRAVQSN